MPLDITAAVSPRASGARHAGDGEICGTTIEASLDATIHLDEAMTHLGLSADDAYSLSSVAMDLGVTQVV